MSRSKAAIFLFGRLDFVFDNRSQVAEESLKAVYFASLTGVLGKSLEFGGLLITIPPVAFPDLRSEREGPGKYRPEIARVNAPPALQRPLRGACSRCSTEGLCVSGP